MMDWANMDPKERLHKETCLMIHGWCREFNIKKTWPDNLSTIDVLDKYVFPELKRRSHHGYRKKNMDEAMPTPERLRHLFDYLPDGTFQRRVKPGIRGHGTVGEIVKGVRHKEGHKTIQIDGKEYLMHRCVWVHIHGYHPTCITTVSGDKSDTRIENLKVGYRGRKK